ncbi:MAG TPA: cohesin domain-containing protein, partial [Saprospiraceae bacterium]|nr:cohesin domain-containing protein [Saprospiraceae bacterium]
PAVTDNCGNNLTPTGPVQGGTYAGCEGTITYTWTYTDCEQNTHDWTYTYNIEVVDFTVPANQGSTVNCAIDAVQPTPPAVTDNCGNTLTPTGPVQGGTFNGCEGTLTYTWTYTDCEQNTHDWTYTYNINPVPVSLSCPANNVQASCQEQASIEQAFNDWLDQFGFSGGCNGVGGFQENYLAPDACGGSVTVVYSATSACGENLSCSATFEVTPDAGPVPPAAPDDLLVDCLNGIPPAGALTATDVCDGEITVVGVDTNNGGSGCPGDPLIITRTWTFVDACGNESSVSQTLTFLDNVAPTADPLLPVNLSCITQIPVPNPSVVTGESDNCDPSPEVTLFATSSNGGTGCANSPLVVVHTYAVTDMNCNTTYLNQLFTVVDNVAPTFTAPPNITISVDANCNYNASVGITGDVTNEQDNCSTGLNALFTDVVQPGTGPQVKYLILRTWTLTDNCGNSAIPRTQAITVLDQMAPVAQSCSSNLFNLGAPLQIGNQNFKCAWAANGLPTEPLVDNCPGAVLTYQLAGTFDGPSSGTGSINGRIFLEGVTTVTYTMTDAVGNVTNCSFTVTVNCLDVKGRLIWEHDGVSGVKDGTVQVISAAPVFNGSDLSDANGDYDVTVPSPGNYLVRPVKNVNRLNGVTAADATAIQNHVLFIAPITNPYKKVCADVNRSGTISGQDAVLITQSIAGNPNALNIFNVFWRFVPTDYSMPGTPHSAVPPFPEFKSVAMSMLDQLGVDFYGMKIGDVAAPWANPQNAPMAPLVWMVQDQWLEDGQELELTFRVSQFNDIAAYQFALDFDPSVMQFAGFEPLTALPLSLENNFGAYDAAFGELRHVWSTSGGQQLEDGTAVFRAKFKVLQGGKKLSDVLRLDDSQIECKAFNTMLVPVELRLVFTETTAIATPAQQDAADLQLFQNRPNPFKEETRISFILPESCDAHIRIMDVSGREITTFDRKFAAGYHELDLRLEHAGSYGILFCELTTPQGKRTIKMITMD